MRAVAAGLSDVGKERKHNEDRYILLPEFGVYVVADGMGGHQSGEVASRMAASSVAGFFRSSRRRPSIRDSLVSALTDANAKIFARADDSRAHRGMGTTVVAAAFCPSDAMLYIAHAGDSRCYRIRNGAMEQLTRDHSLLQDALIERPDLTESDLAYLPRNVITRALGIAPSVELDVRTEPVLAGDCFLLCSDGLHGLVSDADMVDIVVRSTTLTDACKSLIRRANANGGKDNITAVLMRIESEDAPWA